MSYILILVSTPSKKVAYNIASHLLKTKLVACTNMFPMNSAYWWRGKIEKSKEWMLIVKTSKNKFKTIERLVKKMHPYEIPVIEKIKVSANLETEKWVKEVLSISK